MTKNSNILSFFKKSTSSLPDRDLSVIKRPNETIKSGGKQNTKTLDNNCTNISDKNNDAVQCIELIEIEDEKKNATIKILDCKPNKEMVPYRGNDETNGLTTKNNTNNNNNNNNSHGSQQVEKDSTNDKNELSLLFDDEMNNAKQTQLHTDNMEELKSKNKQTKKKPRMTREEWKQKIEEARKERELKKQQEKARKELKRQQEKKERELKKQEEKKEKELKRLEEKKQRDLKKDEERKQKELEKEQELLVKEKNQSKIGNFFKKSSKRIPTIGVNFASKSDYEKNFLPFYVKEGVSLSTKFKLTECELQNKMKSIDDILNSSVNDASDNNIKEALAYLTNNKNKYYEENKSKETHLTSVELLQLITSNNKDDKDDKELEKLLESIPHKFIRFYENVRPPYTGTYSKYFKLPKQNPFSTEGTGFNYDYDSDLEWINDDEDGEELGNVEDLDEDEDEEDEDCADEDDNMIFGEEFDDFLAKEEESDGNSDSKRKKKFLGPLIPIVKINAVFKLNNNSNCTVALNDKEDGQFFDSIKMKMFYDTPVDPLMIISKKSEGSRSSVNNNEYKRSLQESNIGTSSLTEIDGKNLPISSKKFKKNIVTDGKDLSAMFDEIQGNKFSLSTLTEITQDKFTNYSQETIKNTIKEYATRDPKSKLWHIKDKQHWNLLKEGNTQP